MTKRYYIDNKIIDKQLLPIEKLAEILESNTPCLIKKVNLEDPIDILNTMEEIRSRYYTTIKALNGAKFYYNEASSDESESLNNKEQDKSAKDRTSATMLKKLIEGKLANNQFLVEMLEGQRISMENSLKYLQTTISYIKSEKSISNNSQTT